MMKKTKPSKKEAKFSLITFYARDKKPAINSVSDFKVENSTVSESIELFLGWASNSIDNPRSHKVWVRFDNDNSKDESTSLLIKYFIGVELTLHEIEEDFTAHSSCIKEDRISYLEKKIERMCNAISSLVDIADPDDLRDLKMKLY
jgi:hypothetical protein